MNDDAIQTGSIALPLPPLHAAARRGDDAEIRRLIAAGHDVNAVVNISDDPDFELHVTPLMVAAGSAEGATAATVRTLLELGADVGTVIDDRSAASLTCQGLGWHYWGGGDAERLRLLLEAGSPLPEHPDDRNRMLCNVARAGDAERVHLLIANGVDPRGYFDPEEAAESVRELTGMAEEAGGGARDPLPCLGMSIGSFFSELAAAPFAGMIPLFCAGESGNPECVRVLLAAGVDAAARDNESRTAMYSASSIDAVRVLMAAGVPVEDEDRFGWSPLVAALKGGEEALSRIRALIAAGADVKATHDHGYSAFMSAVSSMTRHPEVLRLLVAAGADPHAVTELGHNAFHAAIDVDGEANAEPSVRATLGYLKELGVDIEHRTHSGETPLAWAISRGAAVEVRVLCELGANPNARCSEGSCTEKDCAERESPLLFHAAEATDSGEKTEALLRAGADVLATDPDGYTAISRPVQGLCEDAPDPEGSWNAFFEGLDAVIERLPSAEEFTDCDAFIAAAQPPIRAFVEQFAAAIPCGLSEYEVENRTSRISVISMLAAHETWAERESKP